MHTPVMAAEAIEALALRPEGVYADVTVGLAGHTRLIAERLTTGLVIACDRDPESIELARRQTGAWEDRIRFVETRFSGLREALGGLGINQVDGLLADLGVSRYQLTDAERGFSFSADGPLDMRMSRSQPVSAAEVVNFTAEKALADILYQYGQERRGRQIARAIVRSRPIRSTGHLARVVESVVRRTSRLHPATQTFMALRLAVNEEQEELDALLEQAPGLVRCGGRLVVISFMSLEDGKVKRAFQELARGGRARILTKHVVKPSREEVNTNPASRSAKLRVLEMV
ncbi:MAG: 16S rRNA (cytosine(1402)-N(4))-methyltransferase RsmH [Acidobacteria bacterium]|nr:16S rRNA (cytosine(1402)-N(4))-methyltransferase RsmH [Acidobacteriota bacterium]